MKRMLFRMLFALIALPLLARGYSAARAAGHVFPAQDVPMQRVAIVFGAGVRNGYPTAMLYDRVATAAALYKQGKVRVLLMSGDARYTNYDEPAAMRRAALQLGVPDGAIQLDTAGRSTYDTCYRAAHVYGITAATLVTQAFHLDRALMLCRGFGIDAAGLSADQRPYRAIWWNHAREIPATLNALIELYITRPSPDGAG